MDGKTFGRAGTWTFIIIGLLAVVMGFVAATQVTDSKGASSPHRSQP